MRRPATHDPVSRCPRAESAGPGAPGFTLLEVLIAIVILVLLVGLLLAGLASVRKGARNEATRGLLARMDGIAAQYESTTRRIVAHTDYFSDGRVREPEEDPYRMRKLQEFNWSGAAFNAEGFSGGSNLLNFAQNDKAAFQAHSIERFIWATYQRGTRSGGNLVIPVPQVREHYGRVSDESFVDYDDLSEEPPGNGYLELRDAWGTKIVYAPFTAYDFPPNNQQQDQQDNYTADDFLPRHDKPFFASAGPDRQWGDEQTQTLDADGNGTPDHLDNIYSFDLERQ